MLRAKTRAYHDAVEQNPFNQALTAGTVTAADTARFLASMYGFMQPYEDQLRAHAAGFGPAWELDLLHPRLNQTQTTVAVVAPLPTVRCDRTRIREVFSSLLTNAMRYNDLPDKQVVVGVAPADQRGPRGTGNPADFDVLFMRDNGIGIAPGHHENIFKIFKRLHAPDKYGGGTGAGLAIAKVMVEKHGGELWVESVPDLGATFYFSISKHL